DIFTNDIGLIAIEEEGRFAGFNVAIGGGLGCTHGNPETYPRLGTVIGFITPEQVLDACWQILAVQRDHGNRADRKQARLKYTLDRLGTDHFLALLNERLGEALQPARPYAFSERGDAFGWQ
ncbi:MAG: sulfite reductase, partial [Xanthomonadales bacterium]|nr:sulfite reductase [Xanthomonadales bacterium]